MSIQVDFSRPAPGGGFQGPVPVYVQVAHLLGQRLGVEWRTGDRLPSEQALARELGVNRHTVRRAVALLVADGLVSQRRGRGIVVLRSVAREVPKLVGNIEEFFSTGEGTVYRLTGFRRQPLPPEVAQRLDLPEGATGYRIDRVMLAHRAVVAYLVAFIPEEIGRILRRHDLRRETLVAILTRRAGRPVVSGDQTIEAALADSAIAAMLEVAPGAPVLKIRFVFRDVGDRPVNHVTYHYRADRYVYTARLLAGRARAGARGRPAPTR
jgi:GntR family transcriptional regulator